MKHLTCQMIQDCSEIVTHIDSKGFIYCENHGKERKAVKNCRKLKPSEVKKLTQGQPLKRY